MAQKSWREIPAVDCKLSQSPRQLVGSHTANRSIYAGFVVCNLQFQLSATP